MCRSRTDDQTPPAKSYAQIQLCIYRRDDKNHKILCESVSAMTWQKLFKISQIFPATFLRYPALKFGGHVVFSSPISTFTLLLNIVQETKREKIRQNNSRASGCVYYTILKRFLNPLRHPPPPPPPTPGLQFSATLLSKQLAHQHAQLLFTYC